ncbi:MAG: tannase/feruloyl esterase family alpha/beta hydrolase, partial [Comamonadaceae bacterium]
MPWVAAATVLLFAACGGGKSEPPETPVAQLTCEQLAGMAIPAADIGMPTRGATVTSAAVVPAAGTGAALVPEHCLVNASIAPIDATAPNILFRVALPATWNSKALMMGGGGFDGSIPAITGNISNGAADQPRPIARGYATFASDSGHQANEYGSQDGRWGLNDEAVANFGGDALKKTRDAALFLIKKRYG